MAIEKKETFGDVLRGAVDRVWTQIMENEWTTDGFRDGVEGRPPQTRFPSERTRQYYEEGYQKGQNAALARFLSRFE